MKKILLVVFIELLTLPILFAQIHLSFTGKDVLGQHVRLHHVDIHNVTQDWTQTIYYPDTTLELTYVGIENHNPATMQSSVLSLSQNIPNPFDGSTRFSIHLPYNDDVNINIYDINGRLVLRDSRSLTAGSHIFRLTLGAAQSYVLSVHSSKESASIKMVNLSSKGNNHIEYEGSAIDIELKVESGKGVMEYPFNEGDLMQFIGYVWLDTSFLASDTIEQYVTEDAYVELIFRSWIPEGFTVPEVSTNSRVFITSDSAVCYGQVIYDGNTTVTERGVCWDVTPNPDVNGPHAVEGAGTGIFSVTASSLTPGQTYYYRCYAINAIGIAYGEERSFTALDTACNSTLTDYDGNVYHMVKLGTQCWMKENLRTTHYPNGEEITVYTDNMSVYPEKYRYAYGDIQVYGYHYNWHAATYNVPSSDSLVIQGICPNGWHLPNLAEWNTLRNYIESQGNYLCNDNVIYVAKALASATTDWRSSSTPCAPGYEVLTNDLTGFSARPAGVHSATYPIGYCALFWTSNNSTNDKVSCFPILHMWPDISTTGVFNSMFKSYPLSVRCVRNLGFAPPTVPSIVTTNVNFITDTSAMGHGRITFIGDTLIARGICWSTTPQPTIMDSHTCDSINIGLGNFDSEITGLTSNTIYFVRAYATNSNGTAYSNEKSFRTGTGNDGQPCTAAATVTDVDGNTYNTVQIGNQCWMKENLRTTHYAGNTEIPIGSSATHYDYSAQRYYPNNNAELVGTYGYLYNWAAVMNGASSSTANPSGVQGICPSGWHVPSDAEWTQLTDYVSIHSAYLCNNDMSNIGKALAATTGWNSYTTTCAIGNNPSTNNSTGFSALPAGLSLSINFGNVADFWSATEETDNLHACIRILRYNESNVVKSTYYKNYGFSVRCVRD